MRKKIIIMSPSSIEVNSKCPNVDDNLNKCQKFILISSNNERMKVPDEELR